MTDGPAELARMLAERAEDVCQHYLSNGHRAGRYWLVGDVHNARGRSLYVRLEGPLSGKGRAGKWTDAATEEHGDLLDLIRLAGDHPTSGDVMREARAFLALPPAPCRQDEAARPSYKHGSTPAAARRLFAAGRPIRGTPAQRYLQARGITVGNTPALRYHPTVYYRRREGAPVRKLPAMLAAITDLDGRIVGVNRTWLNTSQDDVAAIESPKRVLGELLGNGVRFGRARRCLVAGEGTETVLSLKSVLPNLPMIAALTARHLTGITFPPGLEQLYIARDNGIPGARAAKQLYRRARAEGLDARVLVPALDDDFNKDLQVLGAEALLAYLKRWLDPENGATNAA